MAVTIYAGRKTGATTLSISEDWQNLCLRSSKTSTANITIGFFNGSDYTTNTYILEAGESFQYTMKDSNLSRPVLVTVPAGAVLDYAYSNG